MKQFCYSDGVHVIEFCWEEPKNGESYEIEIDGNMDSVAYDNASFPLPITLKIPQEAITHSVLTLLATMVCDIPFEPEHN